MAAVIDRCAELDIEHGDVDDRGPFGLAMDVADPDGTVLRFCCDVHDRCYEKYGCSSRSWWQFWSSWTCDLCNAGAVFCFAGGGNGRGPFHPFPF